MKVNEPNSGELTKLKKDLSATQSKVWAQSVCKALQQLGHSNVTVELLASVFPTTEAIRREKFCDTDYLKQISVQYWIRVLAGERGVKDQGLIQRVIRQLGVSDQVLTSPLCAILKKPHMRSADYRDSIDTLSPTLENRVFTKHPQSYQLKQSPCYWSWKNADLISKEEFLAYQLLLINRQSIKINGTPRDHSLKKLILEFWRFLLTSPFGEFSEVLCNALVYYLQENLSLKQNYRPNGYAKFFPQLRNIAYPEVNVFPAYTDSFEAYFAHNRLVCEAAEHQFTGGSGINLSSARFYKETLYFADQYADQWMNGAYEKNAIFSERRPEYNEIALARLFHKRHRIW